MRVYEIHGQTKYGRSSPTYKVWADMKSRCLNVKHKSYHYYGGRSIKVCEQWLCSFKTFLADMGEKPPGLTLNRQNNDGNYEPGNCVWATRKEQAVNRRPISCGLTKQRWFVATNILSDRRVRSNSIHKFAYQNNMDHSAIAHCLRGDYSSSKGWKFRWI